MVRKNLIKIEALVHSLFLTPINSIYQYHIQFVNTIIQLLLTSNTLSNRINKLFSSVYSESKIFNVSSIR